MIFHVWDCTPVEKQVVYEFVMPYLERKDLCIEVLPFECECLKIYIPDGIDPSIRNEFILFFNKMSKGD